ncbi:D-glucuronate isomerase [Melghirimyces profundicolus]|uniref:Uronate isomerase n=1 Tax=Melghirimyces profundicolus TaxID=1242148 RepID=A0A2T6BD21_9BACL|nr:glucuronate isomerase [Melghirimyces profundicolus]PTX53980.1 D-glucuronate isomerase [Melghirimyces profundicolus]
MGNFLHDDYLLSNETARELYHRYAKDMPIIDYHCHLDPKEIWEDRSFTNLTDIWLRGDHYKWRAMRANGIPERLITGDASDKEKFRAWARTVPYLIGNPLYVWTHLELKRFFGIDRLLNEDTADEIWDEANRLLATPEFTARSFLRHFKVEMVGTTDDPTDSLEYHRKLRESGELDTQVLPTYRPDQGLNIRKSGFRDWVLKLEDVTGKPAHTYEQFLQLLEERARYFHWEGCRLSDHGLDHIPWFEAGLEDVAAIYQKALSGGTVSVEEEKQFQTRTLLFLGQLYASLGWTMQLHIGALRNANTRGFQRLGPDTGYDSMDDLRLARPLAMFLDQLEKSGSLPKTVLYSLNPKDYPVLASMAGNYQSDEIPGKIQFGSAWWFNDHTNGIKRQLTDLATMGLLRRFVGMLTDSRSFLSYPRHEYFRRILCDLIGGWVESGEAPDDLELLGAMVREIAYFNAKNYFAFEQVTQS